MASLQVDLSSAPVPNRRYVAGVCAVAYQDQTIRIMFGQPKVGSSGLRSLLVINFAPYMVYKFIAMVDHMENPSLLGYVKQTGLQLEKLIEVPEEPSQTVELVANMVAAAFSGRESCLDFYHASSFAIANVKGGGQLSIEPVVRVDLRTTLFAALTEHLKQLKGQLPVEEIEGAL